MHPSPPAQPLPFEGLKVLDVSQGIAGPYCGQILWQQGADVTKVEPPAGDWGRTVGAVRGELSPIGLTYNAGKKSLALDASSAAGRALLREMALQADVVIQNYRPGVAERLTIGADDLRREKPQLIYVSVSGYGAAGPYAELAATDSVLQADTALMHGNRDADGEPRRIGLLVVDVATALYAAQATSAALYRQARHGQGAHIQISLFEASLAFQAYQLIEQGLAPGHTARMVSAPNGAFAASDGRLIMATLDDAQFARACEALQQPQWLDDPRFGTAALRLANAAAINELVAQVIAGNTVAHWVARFRQHDILHSPVRDYADVLNHPQAAFRDTFQALSQPAKPRPTPDAATVAAVPGVANGGQPAPQANSLPKPQTYSLHYAGLPDHGSRRPVTPAPAIGEHSVQVLREFGIAGERISGLLETGVVIQR